MSSPTCGPGIAAVFADTAENQELQNETIKLRRSQEEYVKTDSNGTNSNVLPVSGPDFVMFGDPPSDHGRREKSDAADEAKQYVLSEGVDWEIRRAANGDAGVFALRPIRPGEFVVREKAVITISFLEDEEEGVPSTTTSTNIEDILLHAERVHAEFLVLSEADQMRVSELYDCSEELLADCSDDMVKLRFAAAQEKNRVVTMLGNKSAAGIFHTNSIPAAGSYYGLCCAISRFNHSCSFNAIYAYDTSSGEHLLRTTRAIAQGEEICDHYMHIDSEDADDPALALRPRAERQEWFKRNFGRECACTACCVGSSSCSAEASDRKREKIKKLYTETLPQLLVDDIHRVTFSAVEAVGTELLDLMVQEGLVFPWMVEQIAYDVCEVSKHDPDGAHSMPERVLFWKRVRYEAQRFCQGENKERTQVSKREAEAQARLVAGEEVKFLCNS